MEDILINLNGFILATGAASFVGPRVVSSLLDRGFQNDRCLGRPARNITILRDVIDRRGAATGAELITRNQFSPNYYLAITDGAAFICHLAIGTGTNTFSDAYLSSGFTTRNLLKATLVHKRLLRFVNVSKFSVYTNRNKPRWMLLDESCAVEEQPESRVEANCFGKARQDELVIEHGRKHAMERLELFFESCIEESKR